MSIKIGYDFDGVICESEPKPAKSYFKMKRDERKLYNELSEAFEATAEMKIIPLQPCCIITGRTLSYKEATETWLENHNITQYKIFYNPYAATRKNMITHKVSIIIKEKIAVFYEDDPVILKTLSRRIPECNFFLVGGDL